jgi:SAM-dependent methyltransferase
MDRPGRADEVARFERQIVAESEPLANVWHRNAAGWIAWARTPEHDSYWRFHGDEFRALLPPPGRLTVDLGCGEGRLSRDLKAAGHRVVGVDVSPAALGAAREADPSIEVHLADAAALPFDDASADLVVAFMSLQDIEDAGGAIREAARVLEPGGRLCLAIVHPLNSAGTFETNEPDSPFRVTGSYFDPFRYRDVISRNGLDVVMESEHRPLGWYTDALAEAGFLIERLREFRLPEDAVQIPRQRRWQRLPLFLHIRALRP